MINPHVHCMVEAELMITFNRRGRFLDTAPRLKSMLAGLRVVIASSCAAFACAGCVSSAQAPSLPVAAAGPRPVTGWLAGPVGVQLDLADKERAFAAQIAAAETGKRASWRSANGNFGFVDPGVEGAGAGGVCRSFSHTLYVDGRAQRGTGSACRDAAGTWNVVS